MMMHELAKDERERIRNACQKKYCEELPFTVRISDVSYLEDSVCVQISQLFERDNPVFGWFVLKERDGRYHFAEWRNAPGYHFVMS